MEQHHYYDKLEDYRHKQLQTKAHDEHALRKQLEALEDDRKMFKYYQWIPERTDEAHALDSFRFSLQTLFVSLPLGILGGLMYGKFKYSSAAASKIYRFNMFGGCVVSFALAFGMSYLSPERDAYQQVMAVGKKYRYEMEEKHDMFKHIGDIKQQEHRYTFRDTYVNNKRIARKRYDVYHKLKQNHDSFFSL